jgi:hypothetical protein
MLAGAMIVPPPATVEPGFHWKDFWETAAHIGELISLLFAGIWAYFNFIRSRTYYPRMELGINGDIRAKDKQRFLVPRITLKNIGNSQIKLIQDGTGFKVFTATGEVSAKGELLWSGGEHTYEMFLDHKWIEPGESIFEESTAIPLPEDCVAVRVYARLVAPVGWPQKTNNVWRCSIVLGPTYSEERQKVIS